MMPGLVSSLVLVVASCGGERDPVDRCVVLPSTLSIGQWRFARAAVDGDPTIVPGFNLDERVSTSDDVWGCFHEDFTSPPPENDRGVDNQIGPVTGGIDAELYARGTGVNTSYRDAMLAGELTIAIQIVSDTEGCATGLSLVIDGIPQPFVLDRISPRVIRAHSAEDVIVPVYGGVDPVALHLAAAAPLVVHFEDGVATGVLGGSITLENVITAWRTMLVDTDEGLIRMIAEGQADLTPDDGSGVCHAISSAWTFSTDPWPPPGAETM